MYAVPTNEVVATRASTKPKNEKVIVMSKLDTE